MKYYLTSDRHLGHKNVIDFSKRPKNFSDLIWKGLSELEDDSVLIVLGDVVWTSIDLLEPLKNFKFRKVLVKGNHDKHTNKKYLKYFDFVCDSFSLRYHGVDVLFTHKPEFFIKEGMLNIHGHFHNLNIDHCMAMEFPNNIYTKNHVRISCERLNYRCISLEKVVKGNYINELHEIHYGKEPVVKHIFKF